MADLSSAELTELQRGMTESQQSMFQSQYAALKKDRTVGLLISLFAGMLGADRFWMGDTAMGALKLITLGGCGFWAIIDWFGIMNKVDDYNRAKAQEIALSVRTQ